MSPIRTALLALALLLLGGSPVVMSAAASEYDRRCREYLVDIDRFAAEVFIFESFRQTRTAGYGESCCSWLTMIRSWRWEK